MPMSEGLQPAWMKKKQEKFVTAVGLGDSVPSEDHQAFFEFNFFLNSAARYCIYTNGTVGVTKH